MTHQHLKVCVPSLHMVSCCVAGSTISARLNRLEDRVNYPLISPAARESIEAASCVLLDAENKAKGVAFFIGSSVCLIADHNLEKKRKGQRVNARSSNGQEFVLTISQRHKTLDWATLSSEERHPFVSCYRGAPAKLVGRQIALCAYQISLQHELGDDFPLALSVMQVRNLLCMPDLLVTAPLSVNQFSRGLYTCRALSCA